MKEKNVTKQTLTNKLKCGTLIRKTMMMKKEDSRRELAKLMLTTPSTYLTRWLQRTKRSAMLKCTQAKKL
jgi:hypothetical protein